MTTWPTSTTTPQTQTRRGFLLGTWGLLAASRSRPAAASATASTTAPAAALAEIERSVGGRLGVFVLDTGTGRQLAHRADERFAMCSTFKWVLAAAILSSVDRAQMSLDERIEYGSRDLLDYAPVAREHVTDGFMTVGALAEASVTVSDNTAANLLLAKIGGPAGLTRFAHSLGDRATRLDRTEPTLNTNEPGDPRDTTTPRAMVTLMRQALCGKALLPDSRERLLGWLRACKTGGNRLRAGLPRDWVVGDKTGSGAHNAVNDVAIALPLGRSPILLAVYASESPSDLAAVERAHADIGRLVARGV
jgi:beta-lactamase class A